MGGLNKINPFRPKGNGNDHRQEIKYKKPPDCR
jgi:hypothetical protein